MCLLPPLLAFQILYCFEDRGGLLCRHVFLIFEVWKGLLPLLLWPRLGFCLGPCLGLGLLLLFLLSGAILLFRLLPRLLLGFLALLLIVLLLLLFLLLGGVALLLLLILLLLLLLL